jgi:TetR/AcrR family transcriptional regulator
MQDLRTRILEIATSEFARHGFSGVRVERIAKRAGCSVRMLYKYHGDKKALYLRVLEQAYADLRQRDLQIAAPGTDPLRALGELIDSTFDYMSAHPEFALLTRNENLLEGRFINRSRRSSDAAMSLMRALGRILKAGERARAFRAGIDPLQLYITIVALSVHHIVNEHTLSTIFRRKLGSAAWIKARRRHVRQLILSGILEPHGSTRS